MRLLDLRNIRGVAFVAATACVVFAQAPYGVHARPTPGDYAVSQQTQTATFAASVVPRSEVKRLFALDISDRYVVLEVACYPASSGANSGARQAVDLSADDFLIKSAGSGEFTHPADAVAVAGSMQENNAPRLGPNTATTVSTEANVGYERGTDPYTGRRCTGLTRARERMLRGKRLMPLRRCRRLRERRRTTV